MYDKVAASWQADYEGACKTIAAMHAAAMGTVCGPQRGVVEDVEDLRLERDALRAVMRQSVADLVVALGLLSEAGTDPEAWIAGVRDRLAALLPEG